MPDKILGYFYVNATSKDKLMYVYFQFSDEIAYIFKFLMPKCKVSYIFFYYNPDDDNKLYFDFNSAKNPAEAMDQTHPFFGSRVQIQSIGIVDLEQKSINSATLDSMDKDSTFDFFDTNCKQLTAGKNFANNMKANMLSGGASNTFTAWTTRVLNKQGILSAAEMQNELRDALLAAAPSTIATPLGDPDVPDYAKLITPAIPNAFGQLFAILCALLFNKQLTLTFAVVLKPHEFPNTGNEYKVQLLTINGGIPTYNDPQIADSPDMPGNIPVWSDYLTGKILLAGVLTYSPPPPPPSSHLMPFFVYGIYPYTLDPNMLIQYITPVINI
jgi:hypothetical protein